MPLDRIIRKVVFFFSKKKKTIAYKHTVNDPRLTVTSHIALLLLRTAKGLIHSLSGGLPGNLKHVRVRFAHVPKRGTLVNQ